MITIMTMALVVVLQWWWVVGGGCGKHYFLHPPLGDSVSGDVDVRRDSDEVV